MTANLPAALEALLMVTDTPMSVVMLASAAQAPVADVEQALRELRSDYDGATGTRRRGFELREIGGGWRFYAREEFDAMVAEYVFSQSPTRLSQAALETLAVIAYKQPVSRGRVAQVRAVNVDSVVRTLVGRGLVAEVGEDPETGATLFGTTDLLLSQLGINSLEELPKISPLLDDGRDGFEDVSGA